MKYILLLIFILLNNNLSYATTRTNNIYSLGIQPSDDKIIGIGLSKVNTTYNLTATRYNIDGSIDTAYGSLGTGVAASSIVAVSRYAVTGITDASSRTLVFGTPTTSVLAGVRFLSTGAIDGTFTVPGSIALGVQDVIIDASSNIVLCGSETTNGTLTGKIVRLTTSGALDTTFNGTGQLTISPTSEPAQFESIVQDSSSRYVVAGYAIINGQSQAFLSRALSNGTLDTSFGTGGYVLTQIGDDTRALSIKIQTNGNIVVVGTSDDSLFLARYLPTGALDTSFGTGGIVVNNLSTTTTGTDLVIQANGAIVVVGSTDIYALVARYTNAGVLDTSFNTIGYTTTQLGNQAKGQAVVILGSNIAMGGNFDADSPFIAQVSIADGSYNSSYGQNGIVSQIMGNPSNTFYGNCVRVDKMYGNDARGERNGAPFLTITAALAQALPGDACWVFPGRYEESVTVPDGVTIKGMNQQSVIISRTNVVSATDVVTMGNNCSVENLTISLSSSSHVQLRGVLFPNLSSLTSYLRNATVSVDTSSSGDGGTSNVYGIHVIPTSTTTEMNFCIANCSIFVTANGLGNKRGIYNDGIGITRIRNSEITVNYVGTDPSITSYIGVEINNAASTMLLSSCIIDSSQNADISQTAGNLTLSASQLINATANNLEFSSTQACNKVCYGALTATSNANPYVMRYASIDPVLLSSSTDSTIYIQQPCVVKSMAARSRLAPGGALTIRWILRKNLVDTPLSVALIGAATSAISNNTSVTFNRGDLLSVRFLPVTGNLAANPTVTLDLY